MTQSKETTSECNQSRRIRAKISAVALFELVRGKLRRDHESSLVPRPFCNDNKKRLRLRKRLSIFSKSSLEITLSQDSVEQ